MIRVWLSRRTSVPVREQLSAQLILGILSRRLAPGERLPSVRELARRLKLHANTISATYQDLAKRGWVVRKPGSGVFVRDVHMPEDDGSLERFVRGCVEEGVARGFTLADLRSAFALAAQESRTPSLLVVDPDAELARILAAEIGAGAGCTVASADCSGASQMLTPDTCLLVNEAHAQRVRDLLGHVDLRAIGLKSMQDMVAGHQRPATAVLIAVVSRSPAILEWAQRLLLALGFPGESILLRLAGRPHWQDGLAACDIVAADMITAADLGPSVHPIVFNLVSDEFLEEVRAMMTN